MQLCWFGCRQTETGLSSSCCCTSRLFHHQLHRKAKCLVSRCKNQSGCADSMAFLYQQVITRHACAHIHGLNPGAGLNRSKCSEGAWQQADAACIIPGSAQLFCKLVSCNCRISMFAVMAKGTSTTCPVRPAIPTVTSAKLPNTASSKATGTVNPTCS